MKKSQKNNVYNCFILPLFFWALFVFCSSDVFSDSALPTYEVRKAEGKIKIDGLQEESSWRRAMPMRFSYPLSEKEKTINEDTTAKLLYDDKNFYIFFLCKDKNIIAEHTERDSWTCHDDCVEVFISPDFENVRTYFNFEINARGVFLDQARIYGSLSVGDILPNCDISHMYSGTYMGEPWKVYPRWDGKIKLGYTIEGTLNNENDIDKYWTMEIAIPFENFREIRESPKLKDMWRINLFRINRLDKEGERQISQWSIVNPVKPEAHVGKKFGFIVFK